MNWLQPDDCEKENCVYFTIHNKKKTYIGNKIQSWPVTRQCVPIFNSNMYMSVEQHYAIKFYVCFKKILWKQFYCYKRCLGTRF